jgi:hypothetical protein
MKMNKTDKTLFVQSLAIFGMCLELYGLRGTEMVKTQSQTVNIPIKKKKEREEQDIKLTLAFHRVIIAPRNGSKITKRK